MPWIKVVIRWVVVILLQILLFNNLQLYGLCQPQIYVLCLLMMPITLPRWADMLVGFALGFVMDILVNSLGVHIAACTLLMYVRQPLISSLVQDAERLTGEISWESISPDAFIKYVIILISIHQIAVSFLSVWSFHHLWMTLLQIVISSAICIGLVLGYSIIRSKER